MIKEYPKLYKIDNKGKVRVWWCEQNVDKIRNISGLLDGEKIASGWKQMHAKNVGRANETTPESQAESEIQSLYEKQTTKGGYHEEINDAGTKKYVEPMLAQKYGEVDISAYKTVFSQPKLDGHRCIGLQSMLQTRKGKRYFSVPHIELELRQVFDRYPQLKLDGELYNHSLRDDFNEIASCVRKQKPSADDLKRTSVIEYHVYDMISPVMKFKDRAQFLDQIFSEFTFDRIVRVRTDEVTVDQLDALYDEYLMDRYEGQMVRLNEVYEIGKRSKFLQKRKEFDEEEFQILDVIEGEGTWAGHAKSLLVKSADGVISNSSIKGSKEFLAQVLREKDDYINGDATLQFFRKTPDGKPRFPVAKAIFKGKRDI